MTHPAETPSRVPGGRGGPAPRRPPTRPRIPTEASTQELVANPPTRPTPPRDAGAAGGVAAVPAPRVELDTVVAGRALHRGRGRRIAAFASSGWVATAAALILIAATAAFV